jgi:anti-sigma B factor antagonist
MLSRRLEWLSYNCSLLMAQSSERVTGASQKAGEPFSDESQELAGSLDRFGGPTQNRVTVADDKLIVQGRAGTRPGVQVLAITGPIRYGALEPLQEAVKSAKEPALILEMSGVPYMDSTAVGVLVQAYVTCQKSGRKLALVGMNGRIANILRLVGVDILFTTFDSVSQAEESLLN